MAETFVLTTAEVVPQIVNNSYRVIVLLLDWEKAFIDIQLRGDNGELRRVSYGGPGATSQDRIQAQSMMIALNKANLSVKSLQRRILEQLVTDGKLSGTVTGTPD